LSFSLIAGIPAIMETIMRRFWNWLTTPATRESDEHGGMSGW
jgi:hypothetical protein